MRDEKRVLTLDRYEQGIIINALNDFRTELMEDRRPTDAVDDVLIKAIDAPTKKEKRKEINEAR